MAEENRILSGYNEDIEYVFENMLLESEDEMNESDVHIIEIFGKPYSIAMGKLNISEQDETLGYFICYLLYENKVVRKLGIYEINKSTNELETINHRTFDFEKEKLLLFDEYYEDVKKLHPYMYKKEHDLPKKNIIELIQGNIQFEENDENQQQLMEKLQERVEKYKPEKNQTTMDNYYKYITGIYSLLAPGSEKREIQTKIKSPKMDYFKTVKRPGGGVTLLLEESKLFENMMNPNIKLGLFELLMFELLANVKIVIVENQDITVNLLKYKDNPDFSKMNKISLYSDFDPKELLFIHIKVNEDEERKTNILLYKDKPFVPFEDLDKELVDLIMKKMYEDIQELEHPTRFKHFKSKSSNTNIVNQKEESEEPDEPEEEEEEEEPEEPQVEEEPESKVGELEGEVIDKEEPKVPPPISQVNNGNGAKISISNNPINTKLKALNTNNI